MEESTGKDETLVGDISECTVAESDEPTKERVQASSGQALEGNSCNRDDLMVEVLGSEVYVGGVCTSGSGGNLDDEVDETSQGVRGDNGVVFKKPGNDSVGGDDGAEGVSHGAGTENDGSMVVSEFLEGKDQVSVVDETRDVMEEVAVVVEDAGREREIVGGGDEAQNLEVCAVAGSTGVEMEIDNVPNLELATREVGVEREAHEVVKSMDNKALSDGSDASLDQSKQEKVQEEKEREPGDGKGDGVGGPLLGSQVAESQVVDEDDEMKSVESGSRLTIESVEQDSKMAGDEVDASKYSTTGSVGVSVEECNPGIRTMAMTSATVENSAAEIQVHEENSGVMNREVGLNHLDDEQCQFSVCGDVGGLDKDEHLKSEEYLNEGVTSDVSPVSANAMQEVGVEQETSDVHQVSLHGDQKVVFENQQETLSELIEKGPVDEDTTFFGLPTQVIGAEALPSGDTVPDSLNEAAMVSAENTQAGAAAGSTETDNKFIDYVDNARNTDEVMISEMEVLERPDRDQMLNEEGCLEKGASVTIDYDMPQRNIGEIIVKDQVTAPDEFVLHGEQESIAVKEVPDGDQPPINSEENIAGCEPLEPESSLSMQKPSYELLPEHEDVFSVPDLVWGKVKSHPWWPGQIFDFTDASEKAMKHHKKDCLLVAYFGDRTFAWNEESTLKSFRTHFSQMVAQCNGEMFNKAVNCTLEEVSRRVELSLACSCIPKDLYDNMRVQVVENAGIRPESSRREVEDESVGVSFLQPDKLIKYITAMAQCPLDGSDDLGLTIAKAQLLAFGRFRGYCSLPEFQFCGDLVENDTAGPQFQDIHPGDVFEHPLSKVYEETSSSQEMPKANNRSSHKRKHNLRDGIYPKVKEKSLSELMSGTMDYPDDDHVSGKRRKNADNYADDLMAQDGRKTISLAKVSSPPKQSFKIGECIRRVASQMTGSPSIKGNIDRVQKLDGTSDRPVDRNDISLQSSEEKAVDPMGYSSLDELLLQLQFIAQDPLKGYNFSNAIVNFFSDLRNSVTEGHQYTAAELTAVDKIGGKRKKGLPETFEFDDMNDTYWTDRVIENGVEEKPPRRSRKKDNQLVRALPEKTQQEGRRPYNRKRYSNGNHTVTPEKPPGYISENAPTELIMNFSEVRSVPSESNLNKMFRRFGPLKETETEVDRESSRARVIFKKCSDAEVAFNSAGKFNIFGPTHVNYQLNYTPTVLYTPAPLLVTLDHEMQLDLSTHDHEMQLDLSTHDHDMHLDLSAHDHEMQIDLSNLSAFEVNLV